MPDAYDIALQSLIKRGGALPPGARNAAAASLQRYSSEVSANILDEVTTAFFRGIEDIVKPVSGRADLPGGPNIGGGATPASVRDSIQKLLRDFDDPQSLAGRMNLDFKIDVAQRVATGAGKFVADQANVDAYPAWELEREYDRAVPRGFRAGPAGELIPVPDDDWPSRWTAACEVSGDAEALRILTETGRMIALKSSGVWQALGDGAGGYDDTLGNPFAPFAFNSGYRTNGVHRTEAIELGLLRTDEQPRGSNFDFSQLISLPE